MTGERNDDGGRNFDALADSESRLTRRGVLGAAAGGFALAASGLLLPEWLVEEAGAVEKHPAQRLQRRQSKQHSKRHHRLKHRREVQRRPDQHQDGPRGGAAPYEERTLILTLQNESGLPTHPPLSVEVWEDRSGWRKTEALSLSNHGNPAERRFLKDAPGEVRVGILLKILDDTFFPTGGSFFVTIFYRIIPSASIAANPDPSGAGYPANGAIVVPEKSLGIARRSLQWDDPSFNATVVVGWLEASTYKEERINISVI